MIGLDRRLDLSPEEMDELIELLERRRRGATGGDLTFYQRSILAKLKDAR